MSVSDLMLAAALEAYRDAGKVEEDADHEFAMRCALIAALEALTAALEAGS